MPKINLDPQSEQSILNMLLDHSVLNDSSVSKIINTSKEIGKTKIETAIELKLTDEQKILKLLSSAYSLDIVDLNEKKIDEKIKKILDLRFVEDNHIVPFEISGSTLKIAIPDGSKLSLMKNLKTMTQMELYGCPQQTLNQEFFLFFHQFSSHLNQLYQVSMRLKVVYEFFAHL